MVRGPEGSITVAPGTLGRLVVQAAELVDGARVRRPRRGLDIELADGRARVSVELAARFGTVLPDVAAEVQEQVAAALERMCDVDVSAVDVTICEVDG